MSPERAATKRTRRLRPSAPWADAHQRVQPTLAV